MPDADDFDVEYFRNLLKGGAAKEAAKAPAKPPTPLKKASRPEASAAKPKKRTNR